MVATGTILLGSWIPYFSAMATVGSALTGLVFVAVSINLKLIIKHAWLPDRAVESLQQLLVVALLAPVAMIPGIGIHVLGALLAASGALLLLLQARHHALYFKGKHGHPAKWIVGRICQSVLANGLILAAGLMLCSDSLLGLDVLATAFTASILAGVSNAWVLLVEIMR